MRSAFQPVAATADPEGQPRVVIVHGTLRARASTRAGTMDGHGVGQQGGLCPVRNGCASPTSTRSDYGSTFPDADAHAHSKPRANREVERGMNQRLEFVVRGSKGNEYNILAERLGDHVAVFCTCDGARRGSICKHRVALLEGNAAAVLGGNQDQVALLPAMLAGTPSGQAWARYCEAERVYQTAQGEFESAKRAMVAQQGPAAAELLGGARPAAADPLGRAAGPGCQ